MKDATVLTFATQARWRWSINPVQPRRGGRIALKARTAGVLLFNVHIESGGNDGLQRRQVAEVLLDQKRQTESATGPVVIGGDFNNGPLLRSTMFQSLSIADFTDALGSRDTRGPTAFGQRHPIDWIFLKNARGLKGHRRYEIGVRPFPRLRRCWSARLDCRSGALNACRVPTFGAR